MSKTPTPAELRPEGWIWYPLIYAFAVYLAAFVPGLPWWAFGVMGVATAGLGALAARHLFPWETFGAGLCAGAGWCAALAGVSATGWLVLAEGRATAWWQYGAAWLVVFGGWWWLVCLMAPRAAAMPALTAAEPEPAPVPAGRDLGPYPAILAAAGLRKVAVTEIERTPDGGVDTVHVESLPAPEGQTATTYDAFANKAENLATEVDRHYKRAEGIRIDSIDVMPLPGAGASEFLLMVTKRRTLAGHIPFVLDDEPQPWARTFELGKYEDLRPIELTLCHPERGASHMEIIGMTGSGKGVVIAVLIARLLASDQGEVWCVATDKLKDMVEMWLEPWLRGDTDRPVIDRVAGPDVWHALEALADALEFASRSNRLKRGSKARKVERGKGGLALIIDEAGDLFARPEKITVFDGRQMNASEIVAAIKAAGRTSPVSVVSANQDNLYPSLGSAGSKSKRNAGISIVLEVRTRQDAAQPLDGLPKTVNPTKLKDNMMYVRPNTDEPRALKGKAQTLLDDDIPPVAAALTGRRYGLDPKVTQQLAWYAFRWSANRHPDLMELCEDNGWTWPGGPDAGDARPARPGGPSARPPLARPAAPAPTRPAPAEAHPPTRAVDPGAGIDMETALRLLAGAQAADARAWIDAYRAGTLDPQLADLARRLVNKEAPVPADDDAPAELLPDGWGAEDFDILAALGVPDGPTAPAGGPPRQAGAGEIVADTSGIKEAGDRMIAAERERVANVDIPDPLGLVVTILMKDECPAWLPTELLAVAIGRTSTEAPDDERRRAAEQLGHELYRQTGLQSEQASRSLDKRRRRGFSRQALLDVGRRMLDAG